MASTLVDLLNEVGTVAQRGEEFTHVTLFDPRSHWKIHNLPEFWAGYCGMVSAGYPGLCLAEKPTELSPIIVDVIFRYVRTGDVGWEMYNNEFLYQLVSTYQKVIAESFDCNGGLETLCCVLETSPWDEGQHTMIRIRLHFPYARAHVGAQIKTVRRKALQMLREGCVLQYLPRQPEGGWEAMIPIDTLDFPVVMYGSTPTAGVEPLTLTHLWHKKSRDGQFLEGRLGDFFIPGNYKLVDPSMFDSSPRDLWVPVFLSLHYWPMQLQLKTNKPKPIEKAAPIVERIMGVGGTNDEREETVMEMAERFLSMLSDTRFLSLENWIEIGKILYTSSEGEELGLALWVEESKRRKVPHLAGDIAKNCRERYATFANNPLTIKTLAWFAKEDNPAEYTAWHNAWIASGLEMALSATHSDVARAFYRCYWLEYVCASPAGSWYFFRGHRWNETSKGIELSKQLSTNFVRRFEDARALLSRQIYDSRDEAFRASAEASLKKISGLIGKLKNRPYKNNIMAEAIEWFYDPRFNELKDANPDLTGMLNCVLEVCGDKVIARNAKPEDYVVRCTGIRYEHFGWDHPLTKECMQWLTRVFTDGEVLTHFLKFSASILKSRNSDKIFPIFTGSGNNSKSMIIKLYEAALGPYCIKFPVSLVTGRRTQSSNATPELARAQGTKLAVLQESGRSEELQEGILKELSGGDSFFARMLHDNGRDVVATFKIILMCNRPPAIPHADKAARDRIKVIPFTSVWTDTPPDGDEAQMKTRTFKLDPQFERRIPFLAAPFMWIITQFYPRYATEGLGNPSSIQMATDDYIRDNDIFYQYTSETIQMAAKVDPMTGSECCDKSFHLTLNEIYDNFKIWFKSNFPGSRIPLRTIVRSELTNRWGKMTGAGWEGIRFIESAGQESMITGKIIPKVKMVVTGNDVAAVRV